MQDDEEKRALRTAQLAQRQQLSPEVRRRADIVIAERVMAWWRDARPACLGVYWPMRDEPDLRALYVRLVAEGAALALPLVESKQAPLRFARWQPGDALARDLLGLPAPDAHAKPAAPDALLIPCVGFNERRQRLGYGGGYYDRTLAGPARPRTVGIAYACGLCTFEGGPHDIALDRVMTEEAEWGA